MSADTRSPYTPRPRCYLCRGRRLIVNPAVVDHVALVRCPACSHRDPPTARRPLHDLDLEVAA